MKKADVIMDESLDKAADEQAPNAEAVETSSEEVVEEQPSECELEIVRLTAERDMLKDQLLRLRAEFDNYRKRVLREGEQARTSAAQGIVREMLPVADNLERALLHAEDPSSGLAEGVRMVLRQFMDVFAARGLAAIPAMGVAFDPNVHEALSYMPSEEHAAGMVMNEFERGYCLGSAVLRPSRVVVSSGTSASAAITEDENPTEAGAAEERS